MKKELLLIGALVFVGTFSTANADVKKGEKYFKRAGCTACHDENKDQSAQGLGPSMKQQSQAYKGNKAALIQFLKGKGQPKIYPDKFPIMQGQLGALASYSDDKLGDIADYILSK